jgi:hypothetical protein
MRSRESVQQEIAELEEEHRRKEESLRNEMEIIEEKQIEQSLKNSVSSDHDIIEARTPTSTKSKYSFSSPTSSSRASTTSSKQQSVRKSTRKRKRTTYSPD